MRTIKYHHEPVWINSMDKDVMFTATSMPDKDWWSVLWPDPATVLRLIGIEKDMDVVDLCCGDGYFTKPICELVYPGKTWALDLDFSLLREAEKHCECYSNFYPILGDARELSKQIGEPVDCVFMANTFHGIPDKIKFSQSVNCSLKYGGLFVVINWHYRDREKTTVLNQPRGPDTELRLQPEEVSAVVEPGGFILDKVIDVGPYHYAAIFIKNAK